MKLNLFFQSIAARLHSIGSFWQKIDATNRQNPSSVRVVAALRWIIPLLSATTGSGYVIFEHVLVLGYPLLSDHVLRTLLVMGIADPVLVWLILSIAFRFAVAEEGSQAKLAARNRELTALNEIGDVASQSLRLEEIFQTALMKMVQLMHVEAGEIRLVEGEWLVLKSHHAVSPEFIAREKQVQLGHCLCGECAVNGELIYRSNLKHEMPLAASACWLEGFRSTMSIPMKAKGRTLGVVHIASQQANAFSEQDREILGAISNRIAIAIENAQLYGDAKRRVSQLEAANLIGQQMTAVLDLNFLLAEFVRLIRERYDYYNCNVLLVDEERNELVLRDASGAGAETLKKRGLRLKIGKEGITGWVAHSGQAMLCNDVRREPRYYSTGHIPDTKSELAIPLRAGNRIIGVLDVQSDRYHAFGKEDYTVLQILGNQIGVAIENARLYQETRRRYDAMVQLHETSLDINSELDMPKLLESMMRRGALLLNAQASSLFLYDSAREIIRNVANHNTWRDWSGVTLRPGEGVVGQVILTGKPLIINDYQNWDKRSPIFEGAPQTRAIGAPLRWQDQVIGGVVISDVSNARPFDHDDVWLLSQFADLATIAIKNAELHTQVKEFSQALEQKVAERTAELSSANDEVARKADQLRSLLGKTIEIQEGERARIARDMHDSVIQLITGVRYEIQAAKVVGGATLTTDAQAKLATAHKILEEMKTEIRRVIYDLHPPTLDAVGLLPAIEKYAERFQELAGVICQVKISGDPVRLSPSGEIAVFRIVEEAMQNVATHAGARTTSVALRFEPDMLSVTIADDGHGFDYAQSVRTRNGEHLGLLGMQERVSSLGGTIQVDSNANSGTTIKFQVPVR